MTRSMALIVMVLGLGIAAAFGARNSDRMVRYRQAAWTEAHGGAGAKRQAEAWMEDKGLPGPSLRLRQWAAESGVGFGFGVLLVLGGGLVARRQHAADSAGEGEGVVRVDLGKTLDGVEAALGPLETALADLPMDDSAPAIRDALDDLEGVWIAPLVAGRGQLMARHGVAVFASYFSPFSAGERQLHRAWSALADGHAAVAREAVADARTSFHEARAAWEAAG